MIQRRAENPPELMRTAGAPEMRVSTVWPPPPNQAGAGHTSVGLSSFRAHPGALDPLLGIQKDPVCFHGSTLPGFVLVREDGGLHVTVPALESSVNGLRSHIRRVDFAGP